MLSWAYTIHKFQDKTLDEMVGKTAKCSDMTLVALSRVRKLQHLLLRPFSYERLKKKQSETTTVHSNCYSKAKTKVSANIIVLFNFMAIVTNGNFIKQFYFLLTYFTP